jgi:hypothetical protein
MNLISPILPSHSPTKPPILSVLVQLQLHVHVIHLGAWIERREVHVKRCTDKNCTNRERLVPYPREPRARKVELWLLLQHYPVSVPSLA